MNRAFHLRRGVGGALTAGAAGLLAVATLTAAGASAGAATHHSSSARAACPSQVRAPARVGHISGVLPPAVSKAGCKVHHANDPANGTPPLRFHGGKVMGTKRTGPVVVTPIFWNPAGHPMAAAYKKIIKTYLRDVASASRQHTNVFSTLGEYFGVNGNIRYRVRFGAPVNDTNPLPADGCKVARMDTANIYADNSGYNACLDDDQVIAETDSVVTAQGLPSDFGHIYVLFLPKHVESCIFAGSTTTAKNFCTINYQPSSTYCAYHSQAPSGTIYANMPFPIYASAVGFTCSSEARFPTTQAPNGNLNADTEISPTSHEIMEAITDPDTSTGWYDSSGFENGDECAYVYGSASGLPGQLYNQTINGHHYLTQEEFSNIDFHYTGGGCLQAE
ncbi:MAG: hypothetical protein QOJ60_890 [Actinomycetota bacterium]|nr:hypothetical protein [Actinomycetota bacterium]